MPMQIPHATPAEMGVEPSAVLKVYRQLGEKGYGPHGLMLLRHGHILAEGWWKPWDSRLPHMLYSLSKSFTSMAVGFAVQEGLLSLSDKVVSFFPDKLPAPPCAYMQEMTVRHLLTMSTGHSREPYIFSHKLPSDCVAEFLHSYVDLQPGSRFLYNTPGSYMLSAIVQKVSGQSTRDFLIPRLFQPLGIETPRWEACPQGISMGGYGLNLKTEDIAKFGLFLLHKGSWEGKQLLNPQWIEEASSAQVENYGEKDWGRGYGYQLWRCMPEEGFRGDGAFGQYCILLPKQDMVIAMNSGSSYMQEELETFWDILLPAVHDAPLPPQPEEQAALDEALSSLSYPFPEGTAGSELAAAVSDVTYALSPNPALDHLCFHFGEQASVTLRRGERECTLPIGYREWKEADTFVPAAETESHTTVIYEHAACTGAWEGSTYHLVMAYNTTPYLDYLDFQFDSQGFVLHYRRNVSFGETEHTLFGRAQ